MSTKKLLLLNLFNDFIDLYQELPPAGRFLIGLDFCRLVIVWAARNPSRAAFQLAAFTFNALLWPYTWRGLLWLTFAVLAGAMLANLVKAIW